MECWLYHNYVHVKTVSLLEYMDLAMGDTLSDISSQDLAKMMEAIIKYAPNYRTLEMRYSLPDNLSPNMQRHIKWAENNKNVLSELEEKYAKMSDYCARAKRESAKERIDSLKHMLTQFYHVMDIRFCTGCKTTFDPRDSLGNFLTKIATDLRTIKNNEQSGRFAI